MHEPVIQANQSLVLNGDFTHTLDHWTPKGLVGVTSEMYEDAFISFLVAGVGGSVTQQVSVPKKPDAGASYELTFLCEFRPGADWSGQLGTLRILNGNTELMSIELKRETLSSLEDDTAPLAAAQPLDFNPIAYRESLDHLAFDSGDTLTFEVSGVPSNPSDKRSVVRITRIDLQLKLEPLILQALSLDEETLTPGQTLYLCLGASLGGASDDPLFMPHKLSFAPVAGSAWLDTQIALTSHGNPMDAVKADPEWGVDQALLSPWSLDCPAIGEEKSYDFSINLVNQYSAEPYELDVSLGHHRLAFREVQEAAYYPVLEYAQSVRLGVQVVSFYTGQALDGRTVTWTTSGQGVLGAGITDEQGWVYFDFAPSNAGDVVIKAAVESPYYASGEVTHEFAVKVLATDPWKELRTIVDAVPSDWDAPGYPNRGSSYELHVRLPDDSPLQNTTMALRWRGDSHEQLGVVVRPLLEVPVPVETSDLHWTLTNEDRLDGRFSLVLVCSMLKLPSPEKIMSLARNVVRIADVREANRNPVVAEREPALLRLKVVHVTAMGDGEGVIDAQVDWETLDGPFSTRTGVGGWASLAYVPGSVGEQVVSASVRAHEGAVAIERKFDVRAIASSSWKDKVTIKVDNLGINIFNGVVCYRGESHTLQVEALPGSPLIGQSITLEWRSNDPEIGLIPGDLGTPKVLPEEGGLSWTLASDLQTSTSSMFELRLTCAGLEDRELVGRLMKRDLHDEMSVVLDQLTTKRGQTLYPCLGATHRYIFRPHALSPLVGLIIILDWLSTGTPEQLGVTITPPLNHQQFIDDSGATWTLDCSRSPAPGGFSIRFTTHLGYSDRNQMILDHNKVRIEASREAAVDPVVGQDPAWMWVQVYSHYTNRPVDQAPVSWIIDGNPRDIQTSTDGWSGFDFRPQVAGEESVTAAVLSRYDDYEDRRPMTVRSLASDPWEELMVSFDKQSEQPMGQQTFFPRRKGQHELHVRALDGSDLLGQYLTLGMTESGPAALGIRFEEPRLGDPRLFSAAGLTYRFRVDDLKDGSFGLHFSSTRLASLSPVNAMSLGQGEQVVTIAERQRVNQTLFWGDAVTEQITVISSISGKPMVGVIVTWRSPDLGVVTSITNFYGVAKIEFVPTTPGALELTVSVGGALHSDSIALPFFVHEPREIQSLISSDPTGYPGQEVSAQVIVVSARTGEPLVDVDVEWEYPGIKIAPTKTDGNGKAEVSFRMPSIKEGWLQASVKGGYAGWELRTLKFALIENADIELRVDWIDTVVGDTVYPCIGAISEVLVRAKPGSPISGSWVKLEWAGDSPESLGVEVTPVLGESQPLIGAGWHQWLLNCKRSIRNGRFTLTLKARDSDWSLPLVTMELGHNKVRARRWKTTFGQLTRYGIEATSVHTYQVAPDVEVSVLRSDLSEPYYETTSQDGRVLVDTDASVTVEMKIHNRYDGSIV